MKLKIVIGNVLVSKEVKVAQGVQLFCLCFAQASLGTNLYRESLI